MNHLTRHNKLLSELAELHQNINRMIEPTWFEHESGLAKTLVTEWIPKIDVKDEATRYLIHVDVPGVDPKNIEVSMDNGILSIKGSTESKVKEKTKDFLRVERSTGSFFRSMSLPEAVAADKIKAKTKNGVLEIIAPKSKKGTGNKIKVEG